MGTSSRFVHIAKLNYSQPKAMPYNKYAYVAGGFGSGKTSAMLTKAKESMQERNDAIDALEYSIQSLSTDTRGPSTPDSITTSTSSTISLSGTETVWYASGSLTGSEPAGYTRPGGSIPYPYGSPEDVYHQRKLERQPKDLLRCVYTLSYVLQSLTERRIELDNSDLRTLEPFEYRVRMNQLDELFMFVAHLMDNMSVNTRPEELKEILTQKGLL